MSNGLPKFCLRVTFDILLDNRDDAGPIGEALQMIGADIALDTKLPVIVHGDVLTNREHTEPSASAPAVSKEASPLN